MVYGWPSVADDGPTLIHHWFNVSCLLRCTTSSESSTFKMITAAERYFYSNSKIKNCITEEQLPTSGDSGEGFSDIYMAIVELV